VADDVTTHTPADDATRTAPQPASPQPAPPPATPRLPTALLYDVAFLDHLTPHGFPETPERLRFAKEMIDVLIHEGTIPQELVLSLPPRAATELELAAVHDATYIRRVQRAVEKQADEDAMSGEAGVSERIFMCAIQAGVGGQLRQKLTKGSGIDLELAFHYYSPQDWAEQVTSVQKQNIVYQSFHLDAYYTTNATATYRFYDNRANITFVAFNIFDNEHREHPLGQVVQRKLLGFFGYQF